MKSLITSVGTFGPFVSIETLDDRYLCDGVEYHFDVVGEASIGDYAEPPPPPPPPPTVPQSVSPRQIRQAMNRTAYGDGFLRQSVESFIAAADQDTKDWYDHVEEFLRGHEKVATVAATLGVSSEGLDQLWILADSL